MMSNGLHPRSDTPTIAGRLTAAPHQSGARCNPSQKRRSPPLPISPQICDVNWVLQHPMPACAAAGVFPEGLPARGALARGVSHPDLSFVHRSGAVRRSGRSRSCGLPCGSCGLACGARLRCSGSAVAGACRSPSAVAERREPRQRAEDLQEARSDPSRLETVDWISACVARRCSMELFICSSRACRRNQTKRCRRGKRAALGCVWAAGC